MNRFIAAALVIAGIAAFVLVGTGRIGAVGILAGLVPLFLAATLLAKARGLAVSLRELIGAPVVVTAWGAPLPAVAPQLVMSSVSSLGAGLLIRLQNGERAELLKVAQPEGGSFENGTLVVPQAAYVQWAGKRLAQQTGSNALVLRAAAYPFAAADSTGVRTRGA
jgi:hypothetical protein